jgi:hypothetical protein
MAASAQPQHFQRIAIKGADNGKGRYYSLSDPVILGFIGGVQAVALAAIAAWLRRGQDDNHKATQASIEVVREDVNGKMEKLLKVTGESEKAKGNLEGRAEEKANPS